MGLIATATVNSSLKSPKTRIRKLSLPTSRIAAQESLKGHIRQRVTGRRLQPSDEERCSRLLFSLVLILASRDESGRAAGSDGKDVHDESVRRVRSATFEAAFGGAVLGRPDGVKACGAACREGTGRSAQRSLALTATSVNERRHWLSRAHIEEQQPKWKRNLRQRTSVGPKVACKVKVHCVSVRTNARVHSLGLNETSGACACACVCGRAWSLCACFSLLCACEHVLARTKMR
eukprot:4378924-Pleurochrysis_carterae.AAC.5